MNAILESGLEAFAVLEPYPYLQALLIIVVFVLLAKLADWLICKVVGRLVSRTSNSVDDQLLAILHRPIFATVSMIGLVLATHRLDLGDTLQTMTVAFVQSLLALVWLLFALRASRIVIGGMRRHDRRFDFVQHTTEPLLTNTVAVVLLLAGAYAIMAAWEIDVTALVASAGIAGLAVGFAAQDTLSNLFAGVAILIDQPYKIGDSIIIDSGERGEVTHIGLRSTRLLTREDVEVSIPNGVMGGAKIVNEAGGPPKRFRISSSVGVAYGSDIDAVMEVLAAVGRDHEGVRGDPAPQVRFRAFGDSSLDFELLCWISRPTDRGRIVHELNCAIYKQFAANQIEIPFPQRDVYIKQAPIAAD
jgi:small-conductance mechanosensitive channel